jgi:hypothetical protein
MGFLRFCFYVQFVGEIRKKSRFAPRAGKTVRASNTSISVRDSSTASLKGLTTPIEPQTKILFASIKTQRNYVIKTLDTMWAALFDYTIFPLLGLPLLLAYLALARLLALLSLALVVPIVLLAKNVYWCLPYLPTLWASRGVRGLFARIAFEARYALATVDRFLTLPLRRRVPDFYVAGFPRAGTVELAAHLLQHPALAAVAGLPAAHPLAAESHYFDGVFGRSSTPSKRVYKSFFPTLVTGWWRRRVRRVGKASVVPWHPLRAL